MLLTSLLSAVLATSAPASRPTIEVDPRSVLAGQTVRVHGFVRGCPRPGQVTLISRAFSHRHDFAGLPAVFATIGRHGAFSVSTRIPAGRAAGRYRVSGRCGGGNLGVSASFAVHHRRS